MSSANDYSGVHWRQQDNPFLAQLPVVHVVRAVRVVGGDEVTTPDTQCSRVFSRLGNHRVYPPVDARAEILAANGALQSLCSLDKMLAYGV